MYDNGEVAAVGAYGTARRFGSSPTGDLLDRIAAGEREIAAAQARQLALIAEFARSRPPTAGERQVAGASEFAVDELAAELRLSRPAASSRLGLAVTLSGRLAGTAAALAAGDLDLPKARLVADMTGALDAPLVAAVEQRVLARAATQTVGQLRACLSRAVLAVDPAGGQVRHERAVVDRRVAVSALPDGMAELWALLPAPAASAVYTTLDLHARRPGHRSDIPMDARRADALVELVTRQALPRLAPPDLAPPDHAPPDHATQDHATPVDAVAPAMAGGAGLAVAAPMSLAPLVQVTVAASTLLGLDDQPAELAGHGPIPSGVARQIAADPTGTWRHILTDPATGTVLDVGHRSYRPPRPLARYVIARDATCRFPGCRQPARRCDLDHVEPWPAGPTAASNVISLCRHHHRLKHAGRWHVSASHGGTVTWTSPTGRRYTTKPPPIADPTPGERPPPELSPLTAIPGHRPPTTAPAAGRPPLSVVPDPPPGHERPTATDRDPPAAG
jgi:Domain of unknown function (DUF222)